MHERQVRPVCVVCKRPEPKLGVTKGGPVNGDGLDTAKRNAAEAAVKLCGKRY